VLQLSNAERSALAGQTITYSYIRNSETFASQKKLSAWDRLKKWFSEKPSKENKDQMQYEQIRGTIDFNSEQNLFIHGPRTSTAYNFNLPGTIVLKR